MRDPNDKPESDPEYALASALMETISPHGYVDPNKLRDLIHARWHRISTLAHAIHDAKPKEKTTREKLAPGGSVYDMRSAMLEILSAVERLESLERDRILAKYK